MPGMTAVSHFIEDRIIQTRLVSRVIAGFQKPTHVRPTYERYKLAKAQVAEGFISNSDVVLIHLLACEAAPISGQHSLRGFWSSNPDLAQRVVDVLDHSVNGDPVAA